jgi:DNA-binding response OmpR family regulator
MPTAADSDADIVLGFESGANNYIITPFRTAPACPRKHAPASVRTQPDSIEMIAPYEFDPTAKMLTENDGKKKLRLTEREVSILKYLREPLVSGEKDGGSED